MTRIFTLLTFGALLLMVGCHHKKHSQTPEPTQAMPAPMEPAPPPPPAEPAGPVQGPPP